jgi:anti-sigma factor RsiW
VTRDRELEAYLLGDLDDEARARTETAFFADDAVFVEVKQAEERLIERYLRGELSAAERTAFERHFAASPHRREQVEFQRALLALVAEGGARSAAAPPPRVDRRPGPRRAGLMIAASVFLSVVVWHLSRTVPSTPPVSVPTSSPSGSMSSTPPGDADVSPAAAPTLVLRPGQLRDRGRTPRLTIPATASEVLLQAVLADAAGTGPLAASLQTVEGRVIWKGQVRATGQLAVVAIPAQALTPGDYVLTLTRTDRVEMLAAYFFRVNPLR